jgi:RNA polymerase sigma-70 factor (ECF subfamily)
LLGDRSEKALMELDVIFERLKQGDKLAWEALVKQSQSRIYGLAMFYVRDSGEAEDLAQEIFIKIYKNLSQVKTSAGFKPWMFSIARNCCLDRIRRLKARPQTDSGASIDDGQAAADAAQERGWDAKKRKELLYRAMEQLGEQVREILLLKEIHQLKFVEVADVLSLPVGTIKSRASRARVDLAKSILTLDPSYGARTDDEG